MLDITNNKYGKLTAVKPVGKNNQRVTLWECLCECGSTVISSVSELKRGNTKSCGCYIFKRGQWISTTLPKKGSPTHNSWRAAKERVIKCDIYKKRGMCSGIKSSFQFFYSLLGERPGGKSLDRINNELGYFCGECKDCLNNNLPFNIRWATNTEQSLNTSQVCIVNIKGQDYSLSTASDLLKVDRHKLSQYLKEGKSIDQFIKDNNLEIN